MKYLIVVLVMICFIGGALASTNITIWDELEGDVGMPDYDFYFYADYTNDSSHLTGATCYIKYSDGHNAIMLEQNTFAGYNYSRSFPTNGTYSYNITCSKVGYGTLNDSDSFVVQNAVENLTEMITRKYRHGNSYYPHDLLEDANNNYIWQPETFMYHDIEYGTEIWRMSNTKNIRNFYSAQMLYLPWSADGKRMAFVSYRNVSVYDKSAAPLGPIWMITDTTGNHLRAANNVASREFWDTTAPSISWNPSEPDTSYDFGNPKYGSDSLRNTLYKTVFTDTSDSKEAWLTYINDSVMIDSMSPLGEGVLALKRYKLVAFPSMIYPESVKEILLPDGITTNRPHGATEAERTYWGGTPDVIIPKGISLLGSIEWLRLMSNTGVAFWKFKTEGTASDGGSDFTYDETYPYDWGGEAEPMCTRYNINTDPWCDAPAESGYDCMAGASHQVVDFWGKYIFYGYNEAGEMARVYDSTNHTMFTSEFPDIRYQHGTPRTWADYWTCAGGPDAYHTHTDDKIFRVKYDDKNDTLPILRTHACHNNVDNLCYGVSYYALPRPSLSPDGTKVSYHNTMFNTDEGAGDEAEVDVLWAVMHYPYTPEITSVVSSTNIVTVKFDWRLSTTPRGYTQRGYPNETSDNPPPPREISKFNLWRSPDNSTWEVVNTTDYNIFDRYEYTNGTWYGDDYWIMNDSPGDGIWYYALTSREHSGLESRQLSNVYSITISSGGGTGTEHVIYPSDPGNISTFFAVSPTPITDFEYISVGNYGIYNLTWTAANGNYVRYYNIYYNTTTHPHSSQNDRMASIPSETIKYTDWQADINKEGFYGITSVDYQGNEGDMILKGDISKSYLNNTCPVLNVVNLTGYHVWNRTLTENDIEGTYTLEVTK